jgi:hypothetical protein
MEGSLDTSRPDLTHFLSQGLMIYLHQTAYYPQLEGTEEIQSFAVGHKKNGITSKDYCFGRSKFVKE